MAHETANQGNLPDIPTDNLGEAMLAITPNQRRFVVALLETGGTDETLAARMAGYGGTDIAARTAAYRLAHNPKVQAAIREEADRRLRAGAVLGASAIREIAGDKMHKDRFKAAVELLNRSGLIVETQHRLTIEKVDNRSVDQIKNDIAKRLAQLYKGKEIPAELLPPMDVEFVEVDDGKEGLEDIL